jgi:hypothetical protein
VSCGSGSYIFGSLNICCIVYHSCREIKMLAIWQVLGTEHVVWALGKMAEMDVWQWQCVRVLFDDMPSEHSENENNA